MKNFVLTPDVQQAALDLIAKGIVRPTGICKALGISYRTYRAGMTRSNRGDENFLIEYDGEIMQFARAITLASRQAAFELRGQVIQKSIYGTSEPSMKDGQYVWKLDPAAVPLSREDRELLGYHPDALLLDSEGRAQPVMIHTDAPIALQLRVLETYFKDFRPSQTITQDVNIRGQVGVGIAKQVDYSSTPVIPPAPPIPIALPQVEVLPDLAEDAEFEDLLGPEPQPIESAVPATVGITVIPQINITSSERVEDAAPSDIPTPPEPVVNPVIGVGPKVVPPGWADEWERLQEKAKPRPEGKSDTEAELLARLAELRKAKP
jgi:hypothetical protein